MKNMPLIILDGPEATGKTTLVQKLENKYGYGSLHLTKETPNDFEFHNKLLDAESMVYDRFFLCEVVYPKVYNRPSKMTAEEINNLCLKVMEKEALMIIFYTSDISILKERLKERKEFEFLEEISLQNNLWKETAENIKELYNYEGLILADISKENTYQEIDDLIEKKIKEKNIHMNIKYKKLDNFIAAPTRAHETDAGADVYATEDYSLKPTEHYAMPLGFAMEVPENYMAIIVTKSSTFKKGLHSHIPPVDAGYTGEAHALLQNATEETIEIKKGDKVGQLILTPIITPGFEEVKELKKTIRGEGNFGSTGSTLK